MRAALRAVMAILVGVAWPVPLEAQTTEAGSAPHAMRRARADTPDAIMPGFEMLADGSTRLFVQLTKPVAYETKIGRDTIVCVLKGAHVDRRNNTNPLVTVHFNTPVSKARLEPHGRDLFFVIALRAKVQPTVTMEPGKDGTSIFRVEFPKGNYLPAPSPAANPEAPAGAPEEPQAATPGH